VNLPAGTVIEQVAAGSGHVLALDSAGAVWAWGAGSSGQRGDSSTVANGLNPGMVAFPAGVTITAVFARFNQSFAIDSDGTVWAWGAGTSGQLGVGGTANQLSPAPVTVLPAGTRITAIAPGSGFTLALDEDGNVWAWGANGAGQLGTGNTTTPPGVVQVTGLPVISAIATGTTSSYALGVDGTVWAWGANGAGQLGDGTTIQRSRPVQVAVPPGVTTIGAGASYAGAVAADGTVWMWGAGDNGQLGQIWTATIATLAATTGSTAAMAQAAAKAVRDAQTPWVSQYVQADRQVAAPYPDDIWVVASEILGTVWWDPNRNGVIDPGEVGIGGVRVTLHAVASDGTAGAVLATQFTGPDGTYSFPNRHSGDYVTVVHRDDVIAPTVTTYYGQVLTVDQTYSYAGRFGILAAETSSGIALPLDASVEHVDFGFVRPNPGIALDKSPAAVACDPQAGVCTVTWDITVTNTGADELSGIVLADRLPAGVAEVTLARLDGGVPGGTVTSPTSTATAGGLTTFTYSIGSLPGNGTAAPVDGSNAGLAAGAAVSYRVTARFIQPTTPPGDTVIVNQAWVTSPLTPISGLLPADEPDPGATDPAPVPRSVPDAPLPPLLADADPLGAPGNPTCNTDADAPAGQLTAYPAERRADIREDSCEIGRAHV
jgi:hypothetical protein